MSDRKGTKLARCCYNDRFDPFCLNKNQALRTFYKNLFNSFLSGFSTEKLLDVGCGTGIYFDALSQISSVITAIDISPDMILIATKYCEQEGLNWIKPETGTAEKINYPDGSFDVVTAIDFFHHTANTAEVVAEIYRVLKPGGYLFVFEPNILNPLMFMAHLIPKEERNALRISTPAKLLSVFEERFELIRWEGFCVMITQSKGFRKIIFDIYLAMFGLSKRQRLFPRQACLLKKQSAGIPGG